jgi:two-component system, NarL family, sensor histidine kinase EvgS
MKYLLFYTLFLFFTFIHAKEVLTKPNNQKLNLTNQEQEWIKKQQVLRVHNEKSSIPLNFYEKEALGYSIDYMNLLANKIGIKVKYITGPSCSDFLTMIQDNELDIILNIVKTSTRSDFLKFTKPYLTSKPRIYTRDDVKVNSINDLKGKTVAVENNFANTEYLKRFYPEINIKYFNSIEDRLKAISFGKAYATIDIPEVAEMMLKRHIIHNVKASAEVDYEKPSLNNLKFRIATDTNKQILINILNKAMNTVSYNEKNELNKKWFANYNQINQQINEEERKYIDENVFKVFITSNWAPFNFYSKDNKLTGISTDYFNLISTKLNLKSNITVKSTFTDVIDSIKNGSSDLTFSTTNTKNREEYSVFSNTYEKFPIAIATTSEKTLFQVLLY